jgi:hypothetical protein
MLQELALVSLFLQDRRFNPPKKLIVRLHVDVNGREEESGEQQVSAWEVICQLQHSHSALNGAHFLRFPFTTDSLNPNAGPAKLGTPYHLDPSYIEYFVQSTEANNLEDCSFSLESLLVASSKLEIIAENVGGAVVPLNSKC